MAAWLSACGPEGCSDARRAAKIIAEYDVSEAELVERGTSGATEGSHDAKRQTMHPALDTAGLSIAFFIECHWLTRRRGEHTWVGQPEDVEFTLYLCELVQGASERSYRTHVKGIFSRAPSARYRRSFMLGFGHRI